MIYHNPIGWAYHRQFVVAVDMNDGVPIVNGIHEDYKTAVGEAMLSIWELKDSYTDPEDMFEIFDPEEQDNGTVIRIKYKSKEWESPNEETYMIMFYDERIKEQDKPTKVKPIEKEKYEQRRKV